MNKFKCFSTFILLVIGVFLYNIPFVSAQENIEIKDITISEQSSTITVNDLIFEDGIINSTISFNQVNDFVTFDIELENNSNIDYVFDSISNNINSNYLVIESENSGITLKGNSSEIIKVKVKYFNELQNHDVISLSDVSFSLNFKDPTILINPLTARNIAIFIVAIVILILSFYAIKNKKSKALLLLLFLIPSFVYAGESFNLSIGFNDITIKGRYLQYRIIIDNGNNNVIENEITYGNPIGDLPDITPRNGYNAFGWQDQNQNLVTSDTLVTEDMSITPIYGPIDYNITYDLNGGKLETDNKDKYNIEDEFTLNNPTKVGYTFAGWSSDGGETFQTSVTIPKGTTGDLNFVAYFSANEDTKYTVIHNKMNLNGVYEEAEREELHGATDTPVTPDRKNYEGFIIPDGETKSINGDGSTTFIYNYERIKYDFSITDRTYIDSTSTVDGNYYYGTIITLKANSRVGYTFKWSDNNTDLERTIELNSNLSLTPIYTPNTNTAYTVIHKKMDLNGSTYTEADRQDLTGTTDTYIEPDTNIYEGFTAPQTQTVKINGDGSTVVEYLYTRNKYTLTLENSEYIETTITPGEYYYGTSITLSAKERNKFTFVKWSNESTNRTITFTLTNDTTIGPIYDEDNYVVTFNYNDGSGDTSTKVVTPRNEIGELPVIERSGFYLDGWYTNLLNGEKVESNYIPTDSIELFAKWIISVDSISLEIDNVLVDINQEYSIVINNSDSIEEDYSFESGNSSIATVDNNGKIKGVAYGETTISIIGSTSGQRKTISVTVANNSFVISFSSNGGSSVENAIVYRGNSIGTLPNSDRNNFYLEGWYSNETLTNKVDSSFVPTSDTTLYAKWAYDIIYDSNGGIYDDSTTEKTMTYYNNIRISHTHNIDSSGIASNVYDNNLSVTDSVSIPGASRLKIEVWFSTESTSCDWLAIYPSNITPNSNNYSQASISNGKLGGKYSNTYTKPTDSSNYHKVFYYDGNTVKFYFRTDSSVGNYGYYAIITDANNENSSFNSIPRKEYKSASGWYLDSEGNSVLLPDHSNRSSSVTRVYAKYLSYNTITFNPNGGSVSEKSRNRDLNTAIGNLPTPTRSSYQFTGWYTDQTEGEKVESDYVPLDDITLYAHWLHANTVTLNANGGSVSPNSVTVLDGNPVGDLPTPTRSGYHFTGWYTDLSAGELVNSEYTIVGNTTFYARWVPINVVKFDATGGIIDEASRNVPEGSKVGTLPIPGRDGYTFAGWYSSLSLENLVDADYIPAANTTLYAKWEYTVVYDANGGKFSDNTLEKTVNYTEKYFVSHTPNVNDQGVSSGAYNGESVNDYISIPGATRLKIEIWYSTYNSYNWVSIYPGYVTPTDNNYSLATISNGYLSGGYSNNKPSDTSSNHKTFYYDGDSINIYFRARDSYSGYYGYYAIVSADLSNDDYSNPTTDDKVFVGWCNDSSCTEDYNSSTRTSSNVRLYAKYSNFSTITFDPKSGKVTEKTRNVDKGNQIGTLPVPTRSNYYFLGWCTDPALNNIIDETYVPDGNITLYAKWLNSILLANLNATSFKIQPEEEANIVISNPTTLQEGYTFESSNTDIATVDENGKITGISEGSANIIMRGNISNYTKTISVRVEYIRYTVNFEANGGNVSPLSKKVIINHSVETLPVPSREWYTFAGWYTGMTDGIRVDENFVPTRDTFLFAHWVEIPSYSITFNTDGGSEVDNMRIEAGHSIGSLPTVSKDGYYLDGWYTEANGHGDRITIDSIPDADMTLYAYWLPSHEYTITFDANGGTVSPETMTASNSTSIGALPKPTRSGYNFMGWKDETDDVFYLSDSILTKDVTLKAQWSSTTKVARINSTYYSTIQNAIDAANENDRIVVLTSRTENITNNKSITIDFNSYYLYGRVTNNADGNLTILSGTIYADGIGTAIYNSGNLVLGSTDEKINDGVNVTGYGDSFGSHSLIYGYEGSNMTLNKGKYRMGSNTYYKCKVINTSGNLIINGAEISLNGYKGNSSYDNYNTAILTTGNVTLNSSTISVIGNYATGIEANSNSNIEVNNSTITTESYYDAVALKNGIITLNNTTLISNSSGNGNDAYGVYYGTVNMNGGSITVSGKESASGVFNSNIVLNNGTITANAGSSSSGDYPVAYAIYAMGHGYAIVRNSELSARASGANSQTAYAITAAGNSTISVYNSTLTSLSNLYSKCINGVNVFVDSSTLSSTQVSTSSDTEVTAISAYDAYVKDSTISADGSHSIGIHFMTDAIVNNTTITSKTTLEYNGYAVCGINSDSHATVNNSSFTVTSRMSAYGVYASDIVVNDSYISTSVGADAWESSGVAGYQRAVVNNSILNASGGIGDAGGIGSRVNASNYSEVIVNNSEIYSSATSGYASGIYSKGDITLNNTLINARATTGYASGVSGLSDNNNTYNTIINDSDITAKVTSYNANYDGSAYGVDGHSSNVTINNSSVVTESNSRSTYCYGVRGKNIIFNDGFVSCKYGNLIYGLAGSNTTTMNGGIIKLVGSSDSIYDAIDNAIYPEGKTLYTNNYNSTTKYYYLTGGEYQVTIKANGGSNTGPATYTRANGDKVGYMPIPTRTGYFFDGWYTGMTDGIKVDNNTIVTGNMELYAHWKVALSSATLESSSINLGLNGEQQIVITNSDAIEETYSFSTSSTNITVDQNGIVKALSEGSASVTITGDISKTTISVSIYVSFDRYIVSFDSNGGNYITEKRVIATQEIGNLSTPTKRLHTFDGWYTSLTNGIKVDSTYVPPSNSTLYAKWIELPHYTITFDTGAGDEIDDLLVSQNSTTSYIPIPHYYGHVFDGWYTDNTYTEQLTTDTVIDSDRTYYAKWVDPVPNSFETDDWGTIIASIEKGLGSTYSVGSTKTVNMGTLGTHTLRLSNNSISNECSNDQFSQTACGYVLEFADVFNNSYSMGYYTYAKPPLYGESNKGGWEYSIMRKYVNNTLFDSLPDEIRRAIINTKVVSSYGKYDEDLIVTTDKIYLLSLHELLEDADNNPSSGLNVSDNSYDYTRQLDYYHNAGTTTSNGSRVFKNKGTSSTSWWTRSASSNSEYYYYINSSGSSPVYTINGSSSTYGVSPAFRIGNN